MEFKNLRVYGFSESILASGLPKAVDLKEYDHLMHVSETMAQEQEQAHSIFKRAYTRASKLGKAPIGSGHDCYLKGIRVQVDVKYTQYWSMQFQRYHFADIISSQSKMHRIIEMGLNAGNTNGYVLPIIISKVNELIQRYKNTDSAVERREIFKHIMSNIPMGFMLWMRIDLNYLQLKTIYRQRENSDARRLDEDWGDFCKWCLTLPFFEELCLGE